MQSKQLQLNRVGTLSFNSLTTKDIKTLFLASLGGMLETYDFMIFAFFASVLSLVFFPVSDPFWAIINTYGTFAAGYFARPLGGIIMAHFGDKYGRKKIFFISILLMVLPTFALAFLPTFNSIGYFAPVFLLSIRILQGIAMGGEFPGAFVFVYEHIPKQHRGFGIGIMSAATLFGILLGAIVTLVIYSNFTQMQIVDFIWRVPFVLGGIFGIVAVMLRRYLEETPVFKEMQAKRALSKLPIKNIFTSYKKEVVYSMLATWISAVYTIVFIIFTPNFSQEVLHISKPMVTYMQISGILSMAVGLILSGILSDKFGIARIMSIFALFSIIALFTFFSHFYGFQSLHIAQASFELLWVLYIIAALSLGFGTFVHLSILKSFSPNIRLSGFSTSYNLAYAIFGGLTIYITPILHAKYPFGIPIYLIIVGIVALGLSVYVAKFGFKGDNNE